MGKNRILLLVEDSQRDTEAMTVLLRSVGVANPIVTVSDGKRAIAYLSGEGAFADREKYPLPDVMLLDLRMPEVDGFDVLEWLRREATPRDMLIVVLSAYDGIREVKQAYALGAKSFLTKPLNSSDIKNLLESFPQYWIQAATNPAESNSLPRQPLR